jgi:hypothetical protein
MNKIFNETSEKYLKAREKLPKEMWETYKHMVDEYSYFSFKLYGKSWVAYEVIAELIRSGWHNSKEKENKK